MQDFVFQIRQMSKAMGHVTPLGDVDQFDRSHIVDRQGIVDL